MGNYKILIIDDLADNLKLMVSIFEKYYPDCNIYQTIMPQKALEIAKKVMPDLIITDWEMPQISGIELIKLLKNEIETMDIPVIIATGIRSSSSDLKIALETGAVDFIRKPFDPIEIMARTKSTLKIADLHKQSIEFKNHELTENALYLIKNKEFISKLVKKFEDLKSYLETKEIYTNSLLDEIKNLIDSKISDDSIEKFNIAFYSVHENFNKNLISKFPNLTSNDIKLCAFLKLGMNTKEIASILYQSIDSVKVSRSRLRKKIGLDQSQNLQVFLSAF